MILNKNYKRQTRQLSDRQKQLISLKVKGRKKSPQHIERIRTGMQNHCATLKDGDDNF